MNIMLFKENGILDHALVADDGEKMMTFYLVDNDARAVHTVNHSPEWATQTKEHLQRQLEYANKKFNEEANTREERLVSAAIHEDCCPNCGTRYALDDVEEDRCNVPVGKPILKYGCGRCGAAVTITYQPVSVNVDGHAYKIFPKEG